MSAIAKFYGQRSIFITGGAGFIGKQTIEKLLRSCPSVDSVYVLLRTKKQKTVDERLREMLSSPVFSRLSREQPNFQRKIIPITGDILEPGLGIHDADHKRITSNVSIFIHAAATLHFMEPLRNAVNANIIGTKYAIELCKDLKQPDVFVYVSTAYSQIDRKEIDEVVYDPPMEPRRIMTLMECLDDSQLEKITPSLIGVRPNTYTFTKAIVEKLVLDEMTGHIPCAIVRPSIVASSIREPFPGWVDNVNASNGMYTGCGLGMIQVHNARPDSLLELLPVDITANHILASAWGVAKTKDRPSVTVFNMVTGNGSPITVEHVGKIMAENGRKYPSRNRIANPNYSISRNSLLLSWCKLRIATRCAFVDLALRLTGKKPKALKTFQQFDKLHKVLVYFCVNDFKWTDENTRRLYDSMTEDDKKTFSIETRNINWESYLEDSWIGIMKYMFKEPVEKKTTDTICSNQVQVKIRN